MREAIALALVALVALPALSAAPGDPAPPQESGTDPHGDAREWGSRMLAREALDACHGICPDAAREAVSGAPDAALVPAPPALDVVGLRFADAPDRLVVELLVAGLDEALSGAARPEASQGTQWNVCWVHVERFHLGDECTGTVKLRVGDWNGVRFEQASFHVRHEDEDPLPCNDYRHCWWGVEHEIVPGGPGIVRWIVPRALLPEPEAGATLGAPRFWTQRTWSPEEMAGMPSGMRVDAGYRLSSGGTADQSRAGAWEPGMGERLVADDAQRGADYALRTPYDHAGLPPGGPMEPDAQGDVAGMDDAQGDVLAAGIVETPTTLTIAVQLAVVDGSPVDHNLNAFLAMPSGRNYWLVAEAKDLARVWYGTRSNGSAYALSVDVRGTAVPGPGGWINLTLDREDVAGLDEGGLLRSFSVWTNRRHVPDTPPPPNRYADAGATASYWIDSTGPLPPYRLRFGTQAGVAAPAGAFDAGLLAKAATGAGALALGAVAVAALTAGARTRRGAVPAALAPGALFAQRYEVLRPLGRGAHGEALLARDRVMDREVVLKRLADHLRRDAAALDRLRREARIAGALQHPHVVTVHDVVMAGDEAVLVMEHARGGSLADRLREGPLPERDAVRVALDALAALEELHARGVVHRDVKPSNVFLDGRGRAKLGDFGVASDAVSGQTLGVAGRGPVGTPSYMSPEQARGLPATPRSDLYGLAATLYEALSGRPPVDTEGLPDFEARAKALAEAPALPLPRASVEVNEVLARGLAKDPDARFPDAASMARALRR